MGNIIISQDFVTVASANITARSTTTGYDAVNTMDRWNLKKRFRADDVTTNDYLLKFDFGAAQSLVGVLISDVNFNKVKIQGHSSDSWGGTLDYAGSDLTVSANPVTTRYQIYIPLTAFNLRYLRVFIPSGTSAVSDYTAKWEIGTICFIETATTFSKNMNYGYGQSAKHFYVNSINQRIKTAEEVRWEGEIVLGDRASSVESDLYALGALDMSLPFVYYENRGNTSEAYICVKDTSVQVVEFDYNAVRAGSVTIKEAYMLEM